MRTTIILKDSIYKRVCELTGIKKKTALIHEGLEALIEKKSRERLISLAGTQPNLRLIRRRRSHPQ